MNRNVSFPCRMRWTNVGSLLLLGAVVACSGCVERPDRTSVQPPATSPAITEPAGLAAEPGQPSQDAASDAVPATPEANHAESQPSMHAPETTGEPKPAADAVEEPKSAETDMAKEDESLINPKLDFAEPLIEGLSDKDRLDPKQPIWLTKDRKSVVIQSMVCQNQAPLEMFACLLGSKEHESVLAVPVKAFVVHAGLLATGAKQGTPVRFDPEYSPPTGTEIEITVYWKDQDGKVQKAQAQEWVRDLTTGKAMTHPWVFAGSKMYKDEQTGKEHYLGDSSGDLICVSNFSSATLDVPIQSSDSNASLMFETFTEHIPPLGTPVTMVLTPKLAAED